MQSALNIDSLPSERHGFFNLSTGLATVRPSSLRSYRIQIRCPVICARKGNKGSGYQRLAKILPRLAFTMASNLKVLPEPLGLILAELSSTGNGGEGGAGSWKGFSGGGGGWGRKRGKRRNLMVLLGLLLVCGVLVYMVLSGKTGTGKDLILGVSALSLISAILVQGIERGARDWILGLCIFGAGVILGMKRDDLRKWVQMQGNTCSSVLLLRKGRGRRGSRRTGFKFW
ncbi:hypothetical protein LINGRAHAP2_LOCUS35042 [Linum grandiflorum]